MKEVSGEGEIYIERERVERESKVVGFALWVLFD